MPLQDRSGTKYEKLLACSLDALGYKRNVEEGNNYIQPSKHADIVIPGTYIQPDLVVQKEDSVVAVIYSTHWSNTRDSKRKFWRTWEEQAQQRVALEKEFLSVNCVFEGLPKDSAPQIFMTASELPKDKMRDGEKPIQIAGWDPGIGWALIESFDVNILFPRGYEPVGKINNFNDGEHDSVTTKLLKKALSKKPKPYFASQWKTLRKNRNDAPSVPRGIPNTGTRYRIGLLHVYLLCRIIEFRSGKKLPIGDVITTLTELAHSEIDLRKLIRKAPFNLFRYFQLEELFESLSGVYVRKGNNPKFFCNVRRFSVGSNAKLGVSFNDDLKICVNDLNVHLKDTKFLISVQNAFDRFDKAFGVHESIEDLSIPELVERKVRFVEKMLLPHVNDPQKLGSLLRSFYLPTEGSRAKISSHVQNWHFEILLHLSGLNSTEDIQTRFKNRFEASGHKLRTYAPYGGHAQTVAFMLQGRDVCELWSNSSRNRTLSEDEFRNLVWDTVAQCVVDAIKAHGEEHSYLSNDEARILYLQNKSMRIISSDLNGFEVIIDLFLGDLCHFVFVDENMQNQIIKNKLKQRICPSWQTDMVKSLWGSAPLETWVEGVSKCGHWLIKAQSSQDGHESDKTKELAGRCRGMHLSWKSGKNSSVRSKWNFSLRKIPKTALVLDGDWDRTKKKNLFEAGWDWVGDVTQLDELRALIQGN